MSGYPVKILIVGAGDRGFSYAEQIKLISDKVRIVGVAEPREHYRNKMAEEHGIPQAHIFTCWKDALKTRKFADAVIIATQDKMHVEPACGFARKGYHVLLEKPMATNEKDCKRIARTVKNADVVFGVCYVLRYTSFTTRLKSIIDSGIIGDVVSIQHLEPVGHWHQAHAFVRGNWGNEAKSSFMLMAKSCHDIDWLQYVVGKTCSKVSSFGSLKHFRKENQPKGAASRCLDCGVEKDCPYSAKRIYLERVKNGQKEWPVSVLTSDLTVEGVRKALKEGPYGKCVYDCDNDVVDHQVVNLEYEGGATASFTMTAFNQGRGRETIIFGTRGEITADSSKIEIFDFLTETKKVIDTETEDNSILGGHGGGDGGVIRSFVTAVAENNKSKVLSGIDESLASHLTVFAAEKSRKTGKVVEL